MEQIGPSRWKTWWQQPPSPLRYGAAAVLSLAVVLQTAPITVLRSYAPNPLLVPAIVFIAWWAGLGPARLAAAVGFLAEIAFALPPHQGLAAGMAHLAGLGSFILVALLLASLGASQRAAQAHLTALAFSDTLTRLPNRALFLDRLTHAVARSQRHGTLLGLLALDLDDFKAINDTFGHPGGDTVLATIGARLRLSVRDTDTMARVGGDEFALLLEDLHHVEEARRVAQRLLDTAWYPMPVRRRSVSVRLSIGIAYCAAGAPAPAELIELADMALYRAKQAGKGRFAELGNQHV